MKMSATTSQEYKMAMAGARIFSHGRIIFKEFCRPELDGLKCISFKRNYHVNSVFVHNFRDIGFIKSRRINRFLPLTSFASVRWASLEEKTHLSFDDASLPAIPTPPGAIIEQATTASDTLVAVAEEIAKEPALETYGLCGWSPVGLVQRGLEFVHITLDIPWWGSIVVGTIVLRTLVFPLVIMAQRNAAVMSNNLPQMQRIQLKMTEARQSGNSFEAARLAQELMVFMKEKKLNPLTNIFPPLAQAPLFISMFMGLRGMCNVPVDSLREGGILWFVDLTVPDQFYLLPIITSLTLAATIEVGTDSARLSTLGMMRYVLRCLPIVIFPFTMNFPGAILCYWVSTNFISLIQVGILKIPRVRNYFKIEPLIVHPKESLPMNKGFVKGFKESMSNMKITRELQDRQNVDSVNFHKAGRAPIQRTFKYDPTKPRPSTSNELLAKKK